MASETARVEYRYAEYPPPSGAEDWILSPWSFHAERAPARDEPPYTVWPDGCLSLGVLTATGGPTMAVSVGPRAEALRPPVRARSALWGARLWPDVSADVIGVPAGALRDHAGLAHPAISPALEPLARAIRALPDPRSPAALACLKRWARELVQSAPAAEPRVRVAVRAIAAASGDVAMERVARAVSMSLRQLQRLFRERTGLTMREYARVRRLRDALARTMAAPAPGWSRVAADSGFVDHAHLTREFVALTGMPPSRAARQLRRTMLVDVTP